MDKHKSSASIEKAVQKILRLFCAGTDLPSEPISDNTPTKEDRNREIYQRHIEGARAVDLATAHGISLQRVSLLRNPGLDRIALIRMGKRHQWGPIDNFSRRTST
jgi:hypothetical protein